MALTYALHRLKTAFGFQQRPSMKVKPRQSKHPLTVRLGSSSDMSVLRQIFMEEEYGCLRTISPPDLILDLGANVGYSSAYFLSCFPNATVVAVEPDPDNFELCRKNLAPYADRAKIVQGAVGRSAASWHFLAVRSAMAVNGPLKYEKSTVSRMSRRLRLGTWQAFAIGRRENVDLLKVDIERSELEVFGASSSSWLPEMGNICIELHGDDCREVFLRALEGLITISKSPEN